MARIFLMLNKSSFLPKFINIFSDIPQEIDLDVVKITS